LQSYISGRKSWSAQFPQFVGQVAATERSTVRSIFI
jgi:hypothetical protein